MTRTSFEKNPEAEVQDMIDRWRETAERLETSIVDEPETEQEIRLEQTASMFNSRANELEAMLIDDWLTYVVFSQVKARGRYGTTIEYVGPSQETARETAEEIVEVEKGTGQSEHNAHIQEWSGGELESHRWGNRQEFRDGGRNEGLWVKET